MEYMEYNEDSNKGKSVVYEWDDKNRDFVPRVGSFEYDEEKKDKMQEAISLPVSMEEVDAVWKKAPVEVKNWAEELREQKGDFRSLPYRLFLYGMPGVGKTTMGLGIWRNNPDWYIKMISAGDLIGKRRKGTIQKLNKYLNKVKESKLKTIVLVDTDTSETIEALKFYLDREANNRDTMFILTGNQITDMKESMKQRLFIWSVEIPPPSPEELHEIFHFYANAEDLSLKEVSEKDLFTLYKEGGIKVGRDAKLFTILVKQQIRDSGYKGSLKDYHLTKKTLLEVASIFKKRSKAFNVGKKNLSDREFQQRLHDDAIRGQKNAVVFAIGVPLAAVAGVAFVIKMLANIKPKNLAFSLSNKGYQINWQQQLRKLEQCKQWDAALEFMQQIIADNPNSLDAYLSILFLLMNLLVEEDHDETKHNYYESLARKYFKESYAKFSDNPEYLFFTAVTACMSEWYFGIEEKTICAMIEKAIQLEPSNPLYKWGAFICLDKSDDSVRHQMDMYAKNMLAENPNIKKAIKGKGMLGEYLLNIMG